MNAPCIPHNQIKESAAACKYPYCLYLNTGGIHTVTVYFNVEQGDGFDEWVVSDDLVVFYKGVDVTGIFDRYTITELIYANSKKVEDQMEDAWADDLFERYTNIDD